ncbi:hypothetical protein [Kribbella sp. CA-247076]|uniref:hypothetical protein n=1 Tax=Kribbella sp. CA-247076 TaxID=3239941 RepID=UPI003D8E7B90
MHQPRQDVVVQLIEHRLLLLARLVSPHHIQRQLTPGQRPAQPHQRRNQRHSRLLSRHPLSHLRSRQLPRRLPLNNPSLIPVAPALALALALALGTITPCLVTVAPTRHRLVRTTSALTTRRRLVRTTSALTTRRRLVRSTSALTTRRRLVRSTSALTTRRRLVRSTGAVTTGHRLRTHLISRPGLVERIPRARRLLRITGSRRPLRIPRARVICRGCGPRVVSRLDILGAVSVGLAELLTGLTRLLRAAPAVHLPRRALAVTSRLRTAGVRVRRRSTVGLGAVVLRVGSVSFICLLGFGIGLLRGDLSRLSVSGVRSQLRLLGRLRSVDVLLRHLGRVGLLDRRFRLLDRQLGLLDRRLGLLGLLVRWVGLLRARAGLVSCGGGV